MEQLTSLYKDIFQNILVQSDYATIQNLFRINRAAVELCNTRYKYIVDKKRRDFLINKKRKERFDKFIEERIEDLEIYPSNSPSNSNLYEKVLLTYILDQNLKAVNYIIEEEGIDPTFDCDLPLRIAVTQQAVEIIKRLLREPDVYPGGIFNANVTDMVRVNNMQIFDLLIDDSRLNMNGPCDRTFMYAMRLNNEYAMQRILSRSDFDPTERGENYLIKDAFNELNKTTVAILLNDSRVYNSLTDAEKETYGNYIKS